MTRKPVVGILCFDLTIASTSVLSLLAKHLPEYSIKAFPLFGPPPQGELPFAYRTSHAVGKGIAFSRLDGKAPEVMLRNVGWSVVRGLVRESDVIMLMGLQALPAFLAAVLSRLYRKPLITINQTMSPSAERQRPISVRLPKSIVLKLSSVYIAQTPPTRLTLSEVYHIPRDRIVSALWDGGASDFSQVMEPFLSNDKQTLRHELHIATEGYVIAFVGTLVYLKGIDILINAFATLSEQDPESQLLIIGADGTQGGKRAELEAQVEQLGLSRRVCFLGSCSREQLARLYLASDVVVLPTRKDIWPKVLVEAGLAGLPLVTTEVCGAAGEVVRPGKNGYVVPPDNIEALTQALLDLRDPQLRQRMGQASKRIVQEYIKPADDVAGYDQAIRLALSLRQHRG